MMSLGSRAKEDRDALGKLHQISSGTALVPRNLRDASAAAGSSSNPQGAWKQPATEITPPTPGQRQASTRKGNPFNAAAIRSTTKGRTSASERAPTLQNTRTVLSMSTSVKPGDEYVEGRASKRQKVVERDYRAASGPMYKNSGYFKDGQAGRNKPQGKKAMRGGAGPARSTRSSVNLNNGQPEAYEVPDSDEDREADRRASKKKGKGKALPDEEDEDVVEVVSGSTPHMDRPPEPHFDFNASDFDPNDFDPGYARSSATPPARISDLRPSKATAMSDDEIDLLTADDKMRAGPATARVQAALGDVSSATGRARTRGPSQPISKVAAGPARDVEVISSDEGEAEMQPKKPKKRMNTPNRTPMPDVQNIVHNIENHVVSAVASSAPIKTRMQAKNARSDWGSVPGGRIQTPEATSSLAPKRDLSSLKFTKTKTPAASDPIATAPTPYVRNALVASTSAPASGSGDSKLMSEERESPSVRRGGPTPISIPSGSADDLEGSLPLNYCAIGFKELQIPEDGGDEYGVALTRKFQTLSVWRRSKGERQAINLLEVPLREHKFESAALTFSNQKAKIELPMIQLAGFSLDCRLGGTLRDVIDRDNGRGGNSLTVVFDITDPTWDERLYYRVMKHIKEITAMKITQVEKAAARTILKLHRDRCEMSSQYEKRTARASDPGPRKPRPMPRQTKIKGSGGQMTLGTSMQQMTLTQPPRRSTRSSGASTMPDRGPMPDADEVILVYPPSGRGSVNITHGDLGRLAPGDYLNDSLIEFGLKVWLDGLRDTQPELANQIHVFSSFFYKKLGANVDTGYASVRKWTSKINIFEKKYLIIPINENFHWYLAIVYEPGRVLQPHTPSQARQSTRLKGDKPDINLADSQNSIVEVQPVTEASDVVLTSLCAGSSGAGGLRTNGDARDEMEVDRELALATLGSNTSSLTGEEEEEKDELVDEDLSLVYPDGSSPGPGQQDVEMQDVSQLGEAGPSRAPSSSTDTLDGPSPADASGRAANAALRVTNGAVPASNFYAPPAPRVDIKGKGKAQASDQSAQYLDLDDDDDKATSQAASIGMTAEDVQPSVDDAPINPDETPPTYIFTFDSLGGRHPAAGKKLGRYLHLEAHDKQSKDLTTLSPWRYMFAQVPTQPNSCDCGVYLLHFAKQFMQNAEDIVTYVTTKQAQSKAKSAVPDEHWDPEAVTRARESLREIIEEKSAIWKVERKKEQDEKKEKEEAERAAAAAGTGEGAEGAINIDSDNSDDDIQVLDGPSPKKPAKRKSTGGNKQTYSKRKR